MSPPPAAPLRRAPFTLARPGRIPAGMLGPEPRAAAAHTAQTRRAGNGAGTTRVLRRRPRGAVRCGLPAGLRSEVGSRPVRDHSRCGTTAGPVRPPHPADPTRSAPGRLHRPVPGARCAGRGAASPLPPPAAALAAPELVPREPQLPALTCRCRCRCGLCGGAGGGGSGSRSRAAPSRGHPHGSPPAPGGGARGTAGAAAGTGSAGPATGPSGSVGLSSVRGRFGWTPGDGLSVAQLLRDVDSGGAPGQVPGGQEAAGRRRGDAARGAGRAARPRQVPRPPGVGGGRGQSDPLVGS